MTEFHCPTKIYTGANALEALRTFTARRVLVVTDSFFSKNGKALKLGRMIPNAQVEIFDKVTPDPEAALAAQGAALCRRFAPELLIALGGGSPMDCAKAIRLAYGEPLTFIAIPTTSGSGSEMTSFSILTHNAVKHPLVDPALRPDAAILDESLLRQLPSSLIADTGMDLFAHCLEALVAKNRSLCTDALAMLAAKTVLLNLEASFRGDVTVRGSIHEAASMAGIAFDNAGLGVCHALAHAIGGAFHVPHGRLCAMLLPGVIAFHTEEGVGQYAELARFCGLTAATDRLAVRSLSMTITRLQRTLLLPQNLAQAGVSKEQWQEKEEQILQAALLDPCCKTDPGTVTRQAIVEILRTVRP
ncbi:MAG: iron-containing alcohol dehydrogenase [Oscillospiraceae bacterium]|nr:iron-containing alcohol dehydrogenase [Oscillospiraceae bacterium]